MIALRKTAEMGNGYYGKWLTWEWLNWETAVMGNG